MYTGTGSIFQCSSSFPSHHHPTDTLHTFIHNRHNITMATGSVINESTSKYFLYWQFLRETPIWGREGYLCKHGLFNVSFFCYGSFFFEREGHEIMCQHAHGTKRCCTFREWGQHRWNTASVDKIDEGTAEANVAELTPLNGVLLQKLIQ